MARPFGTTKNEDEKTVRKTFSVPKRVNDKFDELYVGKNKSEFFTRCMEKEIQRIENENCED